MSTVKSKNKEYSVDRKTASRLLKVSIRTLDRYVQQKKLSTRLVNGRVWLDRGEIDDFLGSQKVDMSTSNLSTVNRVDSVDSGGVDRQRNAEMTPSQNIYNELIEELKMNVVQKQQILDQYNYRIGQLENQLENSTSNSDFYHEKLKRLAVFYLLLIILALQPLWILLWFFNPS